MVKKIDAYVNDLLIRIKNLPENVSPLAIKNIRELNMKKVGITQIILLIQ